MYQVGIVILFMIAGVLAIGFIAWFDLVYLRGNGSRRQGKVVCNKCSFPLRQVDRGGRAELSCQDAFGSLDRG